MTAMLPTSQPNPVVQWWRGHVLATVDHPGVMEKVHAEAGFQGRYAFMTLMSAGIAVLGLLLSSPAVVIGAMLISPLMGPIIGLGFGLATFDQREIREAAVALAGGVLMAVLFAALVVKLSPLQNVTEEIAARTRPNLFDLMVALFSALAGAYAMVRGREGTVVGVAIATALMPPLAVVGYGLATLNWTVFAGSALLFFTNLMTIAVAAAVVARLYGFGQHLSPQHTLLQTVLVVSILSAFAVPLGISLRQIAWEAAASRQVREVIGSQFGDDARISQLELDYDAEPLQVSATVLTPNFQRAAEQRVSATLTRLLSRPVSVSLEQFQVGTSAAAEAAQIAAAGASQTAVAAQHVAEGVAERLALVAGVAPSAVLMDRDNKRAVVRAAALPGAGLVTYKVLEARVAGAAPGWAVSLVPPAAPLPPVSFGDDDAPNEEGRAALALAAWAARRLESPIGVAGGDERTALVIEALTRAGVRAAALSGAGLPDGGIRLEWVAPDSEVVVAPPVRPTLAPAPEQ